MKEVTRIHIAKISYEIEIGAKKDLEAYLKALENYSGDADVLEDVEIRITEILDERGVRKNGVITAADVDALKEQLGEPREFKGDEGDVLENGDAIAADQNRKLFRDTDHAVFGGVLAGIAAFFKVSPAVIRILFIIVALASFGTALLVYAVLWIAVPPARTAADKLQMAGRPVTVESIREFNESDTKRDAQSETTRRVWTAIGGVLCVAGAAVAAMATLTGVFAVVFGSQHYVLEAGTGARYLMGAFGLAVASGTLLTILFILGAYAFFAQKLTKRVLVSVCIVIVAGLVSFGGAIGLARYGSYQHSYYIDANTRTQTVPVPGKTDTVSALALDSHGVKVLYYVTSGKPSAQLHAVVKDESDLPNIKMVLEGKTLHVSAEQKTGDTCRMTLWWCNDTQPTLEIHGPALGAVTAESDSMIEYYGESQDTLQITAKDNVSVDVMPGTIQNVTVNEGEDSAVSLTQATVHNLTVPHIGSSSNLEAGTVRSLDVKDEGSCPSHVRSARVSVWKVTNGQLTFNGQKKPEATMDSGCTEIDIESEEDAQ